jgi:hypothetical protein
LAAGSTPPLVSAVQDAHHLSGLSTHVEDCWQGQTIQIGEASVRAGGPVPRCAATTRDPDRGVRDLPVVRMINSYRGVQVNEFGRGDFGVYADVLGEGVVHVGDPLDVRPGGSRRTDYGLLVAGG